LIDTPENFPNRLPPKKIQQIFLKDIHSFYSVGFSEEQKNWWDLFLTDQISYINKWESNVSLNWDIDNIESFIEQEESDIALPRLITPIVIQDHPKISSELEVGNMIIVRAPEMKYWVAEITNIDYLDSEDLIETIFVRFWKEINNKWQRMGKKEQGSNGTVTEDAIIIFNFSLTKKDQIPKRIKKKVENILIKENQYRSKIKPGKKIQKRDKSDSTLSAES
jgi:hypothetical protein